MDNISIIGGGIGGLVTSLCLQKLNIPHKLYERVPDFKPIGAGIWLSPNALQVFEWIDPNLLHDIQEAGNSFNRILLSDHQLNPIADYDQNFVRQRFGYTTLAIHRGELQRILYEHAQKENIINGKSFERYFADSQSSYTIQFDDQTTVQTQAIIGADGIHSALRNQLFSDTQLRYSGQTCWRGVANFELPSDLASTGFTLWGKKLQFGVSGLSNGKVYWFAVKRSEAGMVDNPSKVKSNLTALFSAFHPLVNDLIENTSNDTIIRNDLYDLAPLHKWNQDAICLIGDAAHSMTPDLGQGGAQAIEDAYYLSNMIHNVSDINRAFERFYIYRKEKVNKLVNQSRKTSKMAITNSFMEALRNFVIKNTPQKVIRNQMIDLYTIENSTSNIV